MDLKNLLNKMLADEEPARTLVQTTVWIPVAVDATFPDRLELPAQWKESRHVLVDCDLFHESVPDEFLERVFDVMWLCFQHTFWVLSPNVERMVEYTRYQRRSFGWTDLGRRPMGPGDYIHLDDMYYRNQCGYRYDGRDEFGEHLDWACDHPLNDEKLESNSCCSSLCPIADCADSRRQLEAIDVIGDYSEFLRADDGGIVGVNDKPKPDDYVEETDWMELHGRPRNAMCGNVRLGFSATDQQSFEEGARLFRVLRGNPHQMLFCHVETPIDVTIPYHGQGESDDFPWSPLEKCRFSHGGEEVFRPYLDRILTDKTGGE